MINGFCSLRRNVRTAKSLTAKCPYGEVSVRRSVRTAKCPYGELSYGEMSYDEKSYGEKSGNRYDNLFCQLLKIFLADLEKNFERSENALSSEWWDHAWLR